MLFDPFGVGVYARLAKDIVRILKWTYQYLHFILNTVGQNIKESEELICQRTLLFSKNFKGLTAQSKRNHEKTPKGFNNISFR